MDVIICPPAKRLSVFDKISEWGEKDLNVDSFLDLSARGHFKDVAIHEILEKCDLLFYSPPLEPRNPELEKRISKLKAEQANAEYRSMTKHLVPPQRDNVSFRDDIRFANTQITAVINFVFAVAGSFFFAYKAVEYALPDPNIPAQVMMGIVTSTIVALADLFFLARTI